MKVVRKKTWKSRIRKEKVSNRKAWLERVKLIICSYSCLNKEKKKSKKKLIKEKQFFGKQYRQEEFLWS
jgi:hypothetical protein